MAFIRSSKFRHVFGTPARKDGCYEGFRVTNCAFEGTFIAANKKFVAACVEVNGGGAFIVVPVSKTGRLDPSQPKVNAHKEYVLDMQWNPFDDNMLATCSEDGSIKLWSFPDSGLLTNMSDDSALLSLEYHEKRCTQVSWHPIASNVLMSVSQEPKLTIWNLDDGEANLDITNHPDLIWNAAWSMKGDKIVTGCKDKKFRIFDARSGELLVINKGHEGSKAMRVIFTFDDKFLFSTGFSKMSERQYAAWSADTIEELELAELDTANGCLIPYYDPDTQMVYIAAKGDSVIRYYELVDEEPYFHYITTHQSSHPQRGLGQICKRSCNVNVNEVYKFYKLVQGKTTGMIEPVSFTVPRKSELFQDDLYPDAISEESACEAADWFAGKDVKPNRIPMTQFFEKKKSANTSSGGLKKGGGLKGLKAKKDAKDTKKVTASTPAPAPVKAVAPKVEPEPKSEPVSALIKAKETKQARPTKSVEKTSAASSHSSSGASGGDGDPKVLKELQSEIKSLKDNEKKMMDNEKKMQTELKSLTDKLKDYDKLTGDIKLLCDAVKKNDERIASLEALVQEESDGEDA